MSDKNKSIITVGISIVILAAIFLYQGISHYNELLEQSITIQEKSLRDHLNILEKYSFTPYNRRISNMLQNNPEIVAAFAERDREKLFRLTSPKYEGLKKENPSFEILHFHLPDGITLLRMHNPNFYGDDLSQVRPLIHDVNETKKQLYGFEIGRHGPFYRVAQPVFFQGKYIGIVEYGIRVHQILLAAQTHLVSNAASYFLASEWQKIEFSVHEYTMKPYGRFLLNTHNHPLYQQLPGQTNFEQSLQVVKINNNQYILHSQPIFKDSKNRIIGGITVLQDITSLVTQKNKFIIQSVLLFSVLTFICLATLIISFNRLVKNLEKSKINLQKTVQTLIGEVGEREAAEKNALLAQEEWEKTFNAMSDIITIQDKNMNIVRANTAAYTFFEANPEELDGKKCYSIFRDSSLPCPGCPAKDSMTDAVRHSEIIEHERLGKTFEVSTAPILNKKNEIEHLVHVAKDISDKKRLEQELLQAQKMEAIGTLAGGIAHDFNNLLSAILGFSELAKIDIKQGGHPLSDVDEIISAAKRASELVKQILTFSRKKAHKLYPLQPQFIIKEALKLLRSSLPSTISIEDEIDTECEYILADPTQIHQIMMNLCTNAVHSMENEKGTLRVALSMKNIEAEEIPEKDVDPGQFVILSISDTGQGMDKATMERIFDPYFTTKDVGKGTGLGLAVTHGIIKDYKGFIEVQSTPGEGTAFSLYFPTTDRKLLITESKAEDEALIKGGNEHILVVDDENIIVSMVTSMLIQLGYSVTGVTDSREALEKIRLDPAVFNLVITDQTMPHLPGSELAQEILKINPDMPIILCSGYSSVISEQEALEIGIKKFLAKPLDRNKLASEIRNALDSKQS
ncbi:MAG: response regulator [Desulfobulbaceae bacterium]|nr:response regulator [Desulfobulbaceae bacterium]